MGPYRRLLVYLKPYKLHLVFTLICMVGASAFTLALPWVIKDLITEALEKADLASLNLILFSTILVIFLKSLFEYGEQFLANFVAQKVIFELRNQLFNHLTRLSLKFYKDTHTGELLSRLINDTNLLQHFVTSTVIKLLREPLIIIGAIILLFQIHLKLALLSLTVGPFIALVIIVFGRKMRKISRRVQEKIADITSLFKETSSNIATVKIFGSEQFEAQRFMAENRNYFNSYMKGVKLLVASSPITGFLGLLGVVGVLAYGGREVIAGELASGELIGFALYLVTIYSPIKRLVGANLSIQQARVAASRIFEIIDKEEMIKEDREAGEIKINRGEIEFKEVCFAYNEEKEVLTNINLKIASGEALAIVGPSGVGKTTLVNLIPRLYDPTKGEILIDGQEIKNVRLKSLRSQMSMVAQEPGLFSGTVKENIAYGKMGASLEEIKEAARMANAHNFILGLENGYDTPIGEGGAKLSGGQRQRLSIARALIRKPKILILDEATSALDTESEHLIQEALSKIMHLQTTIIIAHRLSTVINSDRIIVFAQGRIAEAGAHKDLLKAGGIYNKLYQKQFKDQG
ncbi:ABC transporter ATP-binding protein/permease [bacterium]|nr:ABC transporter ATP-binding protein/permease [bacterium]